MTTTKKTPAPPAPAEPPGATHPEAEGLAPLLAGMAGMAFPLAAVDRSDAEIEADFDNMPV